MNKKVLGAVLVLFFLLILPFIALGKQVDSDGDGVLDDFDKCPDTNPNERLPIVLRNPEFLGCSCSQIFEILREEHCKDVYCYPGRPLEIRDRRFSNRPNPCPSPVCKNGDLYEYKIDQILCIQGREMPYVCEEIITENSERCLEEQLIVKEEEEESITRDADIFDLLVRTYLEESDLIRVLEMKNREELIKNQNDVLRRVNVERKVELSERIINNVPIIVADISLIVTPNNYFTIEKFVLIEKIHGDLRDKNIVFDDGFYDADNNLLIWEEKHLKDEKTFNYRITPGQNINFEYVVQGHVKSSIFVKAILPILILVFILFLVASWIINMKQKSDVFKN